MKMKSLSEVNVKVSCVESRGKSPQADVVVVPFWEGKMRAEKGCAEVDDFGAVASLALESGDFRGKEGETLLLYSPKGKEKRVLLLGLGKKASGGLEELRKSYAAAVRALRARKMAKVSFLVPEKPGAALAVIEGVLLANYHFHRYKIASLKDASSPIQAVCLIGVDAEERKLVEKGEILCRAVCETRDLVNGNADEVTAEHLASVAIQLQKRFKSIKTTVLEKSALVKEKMGLLLAVNQGAARDPALVVIEYQGDPKSKERIALVGKGMTYDTGGLNLKPTGSMETMKCDMAGAATVLGVLQAAAALKLKKNLVGVLAIAENAIGPLSYKPGDVVSGRSGKSVEIANTDAEGRLVLADAFSYVQDKYSPSCLIDLATLTGAVVVALGEEASGLFSNRPNLALALLQAGERTHERVWQLPLFPEHTQAMKSSIADLKNSGGRPASSCTAAAFLQEFVQEGVPWAHLDIAGVAYISGEPKGYHMTPATGFGVRLLIDFLEHALDRF